MAWTTLTYQVTYSAEDVNKQFQWIRSGNMLPYSGASMVAKDDTYDIGSSTYRFSDVHVQNLDIADGGEIDGTWTLLAQTTLADTASSIEFTGLDGNTDEMYHVICKIISPTTGSSLWYLNNDSGNNYGYQYLVAEGAAGVASRSLNRANLTLAGDYKGSTSTAISTFTEIHMYAKSGNERLIIMDSQYGSGDTFINSFRTYGQIWNNTSDNITSLKFTKPNMSTGTTIQIWSKR